ncbi:MAG: hypothetical protein ACTIA5_12185 [Brachybacterium tyrofermentans]|uniref:hypothetical protein n=1 Tax=Brachybacterium tyrofermentans TaxID=47848 RepID=UPI003FB9F589
MDATPYLDPLNGSNPVDCYVVRIWVPGRTELHGWSTEDWRLCDVGSVEDAIAWAREQAAGSPCEVFVVDGVEGDYPLRLWGAEPEGASTTITIPLWKEDPS